MKHKLLLAFAALALVLSFPVAARVPDDDPDVDARIQETEGDVDAEVDIDTPDADVAIDTDESDDALVEDSEADIDADSDELPSTASPLPLIALLGAGSLVSALGFSITRR